MDLLQNFSGKQLEAGTDEAGRGCLAGPVVAAAVILPTHFQHPLLNDSKKLSKKQREMLVPIIEEQALSFAVSFVYQDEIDEINILQASITAMHRSIDQLTIKPEFIIVDGNKFRVYGDIPSETIVKGDSKYLSIAAASILAKTYRDRYMDQIHQDFEMYQWHKNKGYPTKTHRAAILTHGACKHHRMTFKLLKDEDQLCLF